MANPNFKPEWPLYSDAAGVFVSALPIKTITYANDGSAVVTFDGAYAEKRLSAQFVNIFKPQAGGYVFRSQYGELLYMSKTDFEARYTKSAGVSVSWADVDGKPATFPPAIGTTATTARAGNWVPAWGDVTDKPTTFAPVAATDSVVGGVKKGVAVANSAATDVAGVNTTINALLKSLRDAGVITSS